jgi:3-keto-5-aminohexanoate cleavage enzyme
MIRDLPEDSYWSFAGIGDAQLMMNSLAIAAGGGVRVGLEDTIWYDQKRTRLATNSDLLQRVHMLAKANERKIMSPENLRKRLNLHEGFGKYGFKERF